jgi:hypothetical protein
MSEVQKSKAIGMRRFWLTLAGIAAYTALCMYGVDAVSSGIGLTAILGQNAATKFSKSSDA